MKIGMISLGCDKNRVDSERMLFQLTQAGFTLTENQLDAEIMIINTCAFIDKAKIEAIDTVLETAELKKKGVLKKLVVAGCFAERFGEEAELSEVDLFVNIKEERDIAAKIQALIGVEPNSAPYGEGRILTTYPHLAYLKIADGCDNRCSYCAIPSIRGKYRSEPPDKLLAEAKELAASGVKELILVAQDTTNYGCDLFGTPSLLSLLRELVKLPVWKIRLLYVYPELLTDELIAFVAAEERMAKYLDIPMQHIDSMILKKMNRRSGEDTLRALLRRIREVSPEIAVRSTFISGFPFEGEDEHRKLCEWVDGGLDYAGFFAYSPEEGTASVAFTPRADKKTVARRVRELERLQANTTATRHARYLHTVREVLYEGIDYRLQCFYGRTEQNAPEIDTRVFFTANRPLAVGTVYRVRITRAEFHLYGELEEDV